MHSEADRRRIEAVKRFYEAESEVASDDIVWHVPGHNPVSGVYRGRREYEDVMPSKMAPLDRWDFQLFDFLVNGDLVIATFRAFGERRGVHLETTGAHLLRVDDSYRVVEGWGFATMQDELDAFFEA